MKIEELAYHKTPLGDLTLRRRPEPLLNNTDVFEVKLGDEFLMSSLFVDGERAVAEFGLDGLEGGLDVIVGGLGLGYTAAAALENKNVASLIVVEAFEEVILWHLRGLIPMADVLTADNRCDFVRADFFELAAAGFDVEEPGKLFDAVLLDIDHTPEHYLDPKHAEFYSPNGLENLRKQLKKGGSFALWSDDQADDDFVNLLRETFGTATGHNVKFRNPYNGELAVNSVYVARNTNS